MNDYLDRDGNPIEDEQGYAAYNVKNLPGSAVCFAYCSGKTAKQMIDNSTDRRRLVFVLKGDRTMTLHSTSWDCCPGTTFTAESAPEAEELHVREHNAQFLRGRRVEFILPATLDENYRAWISTDGFVSFCISEQMRLNALMAEINDAPVMDDTEWNIALHAFRQVAAQSDRGLRLMRALTEQYREMVSDSRNMA